MAGLLDNFFGGEGLLGRFGNRAASAFDDPLFMTGMGLLSAHTPQQGIQNAMQNIMLQRAFAAQRDDKAKAEARDLRDFNFRKDESARSQENANRAYQMQVTEAARAQQNADRSYGLQERGMTARAVPEGFEMDPNTPGALRPRAGGPADPTYKRMVGDRQNAPAGYAWIDPNNPTAGMKAIPGGPGEKVDAEVAARLGMAKSFLGQAPEIRRRVEAGELSGPIDGQMGYWGIGQPAQIRRQIDSGIDALLRNLTGAGMSVSEAAAYAERYRPSATDSASTITSKLDQLERELRSVSDVVGRGRGGDVLNAQPTAPINPGGALAAQGGLPRMSSPDQAAKLPKGTRFIDPNGVVRVVP